MVRRASHPDPDILVVDAEGFDHQILSQFDFARLSTRLVIYETESMSADHAADLKQRLQAAGFAILDADQDTVALRRDSAAFRRRGVPEREVANA